jgi:hypothetical protein
LPLVVVQLPEQEEQLVVQVPKKQKYPAELAPMAVVAKALKLTG